jgi:hypothetical protein
MHHTGPYRYQIRSTYLWYQHYSQIVLCFSFVNSVKELAEIK